MSDGPQWYEMSTNDGREFYVDEQGFGLVLMVQDFEDDVDFEIEDGGYYTRPGGFDPVDWEDYDL